MKVSSLTDECLSLEVKTNLRESDDGDVLGFHEESDTKHMGETISSCEEASTDLAHELERTKLDSGYQDLNGFSDVKCEKERGDNRMKESSISNPEMIDGEEASEEKGDNFVPIDVISNAVRTRRSILRRTSSTSTDESLGDESESNGMPESPTKKNVRFNLNPNVRVFSNKKDKKKRKLEAKLKAEARRHSLESESSGSEQSNGTSPVDFRTGCENGFGDQSRGKDLDVQKSAVVKDEGEDQGDCKINPSNNQTTQSVDSSHNESFLLTNNLIFELDD